MYFLGADVGSLTTKVALIDQDGQLLFSSYRRNDDGPIAAVQQAFAGIKGAPGSPAAAGTTGWEAPAVMIGADTVVNGLPLMPWPRGQLNRRFARSSISGAGFKIIYIKTESPLVSI